MMITKYEFRGEKDGISLLILAAVHGNETAGTQACFRIIDEFNRGALRLTLRSFDFGSGLQSGGLSQRCSQY